MLQFSLNLAPSVFALFLIACLLRFDVNASVFLVYHKVLRLDKNPLTNISVFLLDHPNLAKLQWLYLPR